MDEPNRKNTVDGAVSKASVHLSPDPPVQQSAAGPSDDQRISEEFQVSLRDSLQRNPRRQAIAAERRAGFEVQLDRHEAKYIIPRQLVPKIREFIKPFCQPDPHGEGDPAEYVVTTLQLDSPQLSLHHAKEHEALTRFKLRVRTYGEPPGGSPVFMEIKRKIRGTILKSRTRVPFACWNEDLIRKTAFNLQFKSRQEETAFLDFRRLVHEIDARPVVLLRYRRESYFSKLDNYARVSFDRRITYQPTRSWDSWGEGCRWISVDSSQLQNKGYPFSGVILELKTLSDTPQWMIDLVMNFSLARTGHCKYSNAIWQESLFRGSPSMPAYAMDLLSY